MYSNQDHHVAILPTTSRPPMNKGGIDEGTPASNSRNHSKLTTNKSYQQKSVQRNMESRDDGDQEWVKHSSPGVPKQPTSPRPSVVNNKDSTNPPPRKVHQRHNQIATVDLHSPSLSNDLHQDVLRAERDQLAARLKDLELQFEAIQKRKAFEKSRFEMHRGQLMVELEALQEDKNYLIKKRDKLKEQLLEVHTRNRMAQTKAKAKP